MANDLIKWKPWKKDMVQLDLKKQATVSSTHEKMNSANNLNVMGSE